MSRILRDVWGAQHSDREINFKIGGDRIPIKVVHALALIKKAAAIVNCELGLLTKRKNGTE